MLRYTGEAVLPPFWKWLARAGAPIAAILIPAAFFLFVASPGATQPNGLIELAYVGVWFLAASVLSLGVGLICAAKRENARTAWRRQGRKTGARGRGCATARFARRTGGKTAGVTDSGFSSRFAGRFAPN